jgi:hypothetical protein
MYGDVSIDVGAEALYYLEDRIRALFGKDEATQTWNATLHQRLRSSLEQAKWVQCIGMAEPIPIESIYQPLKLSTPHSGATDVFELIRDGKSAVVLAGPGRGKSTLLNWLFVQLLRNDNVSVFLFILRSQHAVPDLSEFVHRLQASDGKSTSGKKKLILLVDGYDEIDVDNRKSVSAALNAFKTKNVGSFILTCRTFYDVYDLSAAHYSLSAFSDDDAIRFIRAFSRSFKVELHDVQLVNELHRRGFEDFLLHPLLLCLICILKSGPLPDLPHNTLGLLKRVFDTLTLRWDQSRGVARSSEYALDGEERVRCLMRTAYSMRELRERQESVEGFIREHMQMIQRKGIDARMLLYEMAQWYGVLVPVEQDLWQFVHRSIHDYLAARFWVESGRFTSVNIIENWDARVAYALCLSPDATWGIKESLDRGNTLQVLSECMYNFAAFETEPIAQSILSLFERSAGQCKLQCGTADHPSIQADGPGELLKLASDRLLLHLIGAASTRDTEAAAVIVLCGIGEALRRKKPVQDVDLAAKLIRQFGATTPIETPARTYILRHAFFSGGTL